MSKKSRRETRENRCKVCRVNQKFCFCDDLTPIQAQTPVHIIMHVNERSLTSNTAYLADLLMDKCQTHLRGIQDDPILESDLLDPAYQPLYLFPDEDAKELSIELIESFDRPLSLIVPDGSWRQAKKFKSRMPFLKDVPSVTIPFSGESQYRLRKSPFKEAVCTYEAIARALGIIEGQNLRERLEVPFMSMVKNHFYARYGRVAYEEAFDSKKE
ncbi:DTW domain-containing protein [Halobacteriovorax sp. GB3]|uniref:tRNA-uridine aminocarboxypropyltransferase n=1 Tax=Halobacteriovorax sp. GB3 TaxID=2719615 RepID=UPI00235FF849|nr:tRNA-uridine aminocarboxypropyltransferase [Halobacteriovorax sp. GB3]MDD0852889.1 DTW domain-containing protein [Halobacteriovorax sp. GB3]